MRLAYFFAAAVALWGAPLSAQIAGLYVCETTAGSFRYVIDTRSNTLRVNDYPIARYTRSRDRSLAEIQEYNILLDGWIKVPPQYLRGPTQFSFTLFGTSEAGIFLRDNYVTAFAPRADIAASAEEEDQAAGPIPCEAARR